MSKCLINSSLKMAMLLLSMLMLLSSCFIDLSSPRTNRTHESLSNPNPTDPTFSTPLNYLQDGQTISSTLFNIGANFSGHFYLRGKEINTFIQSSDITERHCLLANFPSSTNNQVLIVAVSPHSFFNFSENTKEYYYLIEPNNTSLNQTYCQTSGLITYSSNQYSTTGIAYSFNDLCPSCTSGQLDSNPIKLMTVDGGLIDQVALTYLSIRLKTDPFADNEENVTCQTTADCSGQGYDCCAEGHCINDATIKANVDKNSSEYLQAILDVNQSPENYRSYPTIYNICPIGVMPTPVPTPTLSPEEQAARRLEYLEELYQCTTPIRGEMSICTMTYEEASTLGGTFFTDQDDRSFDSTYSGTVSTYPNHSIYKITYNSQSIYQNGTGGSGISISGGNDNLYDVTRVDITAPLTPNANNEDTLKIFYKIDGSCEYMGTAISRCSKYYIQGQNDGELDDHYPASNIFYLPYHADMSRAITVEVDDTLKLEDYHYQIVNAAPAYIEFIGTGLQIYDTQAVKISYYVDNVSNPVLVKKLQALNEINSMCDCNGPYCSLKPVYESENTTVISDYSCVYPPPAEAEPPMSQTVYLSAKSAPLKYFDLTGVHHGTVDLDTSEQEGTEFEYTSNNLLKPNNVTNDIGFNEIYGSLSASTNAAQPALEVKIKKGKTYDIYVDTGNFSTCYFCGNDYYSALAKIFPDNFLYHGGGYRPSASETSRLDTRSFRADDLLFGRACFIPATMIPWTHRSNSDRQQQRMNRMRAQHFLFANGYQKDWYGFDYGSVIGSFDGVTWFSVGNQRRIKATTSRLYLAVNAYFSDLTSNSSFTMTVQEATIFDPNAITNDINSDGAECQKFHLCSTDQDCVTQLGWEYSCQSVSGIDSNWPMFDENGVELPGAETLTRLIQLFSTQGSTKRCVYRGKGAPCHTSYEVDANVSYSGTDYLGLHSCSSNNYCQRFVDGIEVPRFNTKISRFARSPLMQNLSTSVPDSVKEDTFGLGAHILGRPFNFNGEDPIVSDVRSQLTSNSVISLCIPGHNPGNTTFRQSNYAIPTSSYMGDRVSGIGMTPSGSSPNDYYYSSCGILDSGGNFLRNDSSFYNLTLSNGQVEELSSGQALSTNALEIFENMTGEDILQNFESSIIEAPAFQANRCLRAPGSACFSDIDCGSNKIIEDFLIGINSDDTTLHTTLNKYEIDFWKEGLVCKPNKDPDDEDFDLNNNRCCRDSGKTLTIGTYKNQSGFADFDSSSIPGIDISFSSSRRYSRLTTVGTELKNNSVPALETAADNQCSTGTCADESITENQFKTFSKIADRTCCSGHWVRHFADSNGGGHKWSADKAQNISSDNFRCLNWEPRGAGNPNDPFSCADSATIYDGDCLVKQLSEVQAKTYFDWFNTLELLGVPQIKVKTEDFSEILCNVDPNSQTIPSPYVAGDMIIPDTIQTTSTETAEFEDSANNQYYSADDMDNFSGNLKQIFSRDKVSCCKPVGSEMANTEPASSCCSQVVSGGRCCLPDYTNLSVYYNRFISSGGSDLPDSNFNPDTGYPASIDVVIRLASEQNPCCSGNYYTGIAHYPFKVNGHTGDTVDPVSRLINDQDSGGTANDNGLLDLYNAGLRWNTNLYCVPQNFTAPDTN